MKLDNIIEGMFGLILVFLILSRADSFNTVVKALGGFVTKQTAVLQGINPSTGYLVGAAPSNGNNNASSIFGGGYTY